MDRNVTFSSARVKSERTNGALFELGHPFVGSTGRSSDLEHLVPIPFWFPFPWTAQILRRNIYPVFQ